MRALSIQQPYAWLIVNGYKDIENRTWSTSFRGEFYIHAGKKIAKLTDYEKQAIEIKIGRALPEEFETGGIVGKAEIAGCSTWTSSFWFGGPFGFSIKNAKPLPFVPCKGKLSFFEAGTEHQEDVI